jgi:hypothetical protein
MIVKHREKFIFTFILPYITLWKRNFVFKSETKTFYVMQKWNVKNLEACGHLDRVKNDYSADGLQIGSICYGKQN